MSVTEPYQPWLPDFEHIHFPTKEKEVPVQPLRADKIQAMIDLGLKRPWAVTSECARRMYPLRKEFVNQYLLPFAEFKKFNEKQSRIIEELDFLFFERDENGEVYKVRKKKRNLGKQISNLQWTKNRCSGFFCDFGTYYVFQYGEDAMMARLYYG